MQSANFNCYSLKMTNFRKKILILLVSSFYEIFAYLFFGIDLYFFDSDRNSCIQKKVEIQQSEKFSTQDSSLNSKELPILGNNILRNGTGEVFNI